VAAGIGLGLLAQPAKISQVRVEDGIPTLFVHGKLTPPLMFWLPSPLGLLARDGDGLVLSQHPGQGWAGVQVPSGRLVIEADVTMAEAFVPDATALLQATGGPGAVEGYLLGLQYLPEGNRIKLWKSTRYGWDTWFTIPWPWQMGKAVRLRLEVDGARVAGYADGQLVAQRDDPQPVSPRWVTLGAYCCRARFEKVNGAAGGAALPALAFEGGRLAPPWRASAGSSQISALARVGIHLFSFGFSAADWWIGDRRYSFDLPEVLLRSMVEADPRAMALLRVDINPPAWWLEAHPSERMLARSLDGREWGLPWACFASKQWLEDAGAALDALIRHFSASPLNEHILGWHFAAGDCGEWSYYWGEGVTDYSPAQTAAFRQWLRDRYGGDAGLRRAWHRDDVSLEAAEIPLPRRRYIASLGFLYDPVREADCIDYRRFHSEAAADAICHFAQIAKRACGGRQIVGAFYGYHLPGAWRPADWHDAGHQALARVLACPHLDFICAPNNYRNRGPGGGCAPQTLPASIALAGKLYLAEDDTRTFLTPDDDAHSIGRCPDLQTTVAVLERNWAAAATQGGGLWWMDQGGGWYDDSELVAALGRLVRRHAELPSAAFRSLAEIAVVVDEPSAAYMAQSLDLLLPLLVAQVVDELAYVGAPFDLLLTTDLPRARPYKLYIVPCAPAPSEETRRALRALYRPGATVLWLHAPGLLTDAGPSAEAASELVGMKLALRMIGGPTHIRLLAGSWLSRGFPAGFSYGTDRCFGPLLEVVDPDAEILGVARCSSMEMPGGILWPLPAYAGPGLAAKKVGGARVIFSAAGPLPAPLVRCIAREAGVNLFDADGNVVYASEGLVAVHDAAAGRWTRLEQRRR